MITITYCKNYIHTKYNQILAVKVTNAKSKNCLVYYLLSLELGLF